MELVELLQISSQAAHKTLRKLQDYNIITQKGSGKLTYYVLNRVDERLRTDDENFKFLLNISKIWE